MSGAGLTGCDCSQERIDADAAIVVDAPMGWFHSSAHAERVDAVLAAAAPTDNDLSATAAEVESAPVGPEREP